MKVTVVIPALNEEENLRNCLDALSRQTLTDFEVIVVDGGSSDSTVDVARGFGAQVVVLKERGIARARERGFREAKTPLIASTDADSLPPPHWLESLLGPFSDPRVVGVYGTTAHRGVKDLGAKSFRLWQRLHHLLRLPIFLGPNFAVRREAFLRVGGFQEPGGDFPSSYPEADDFLIGLKLVRLGKVVFLPELCVTTSDRRLSLLHFPRELVLYTHRYFQLLCWHYTGRLVPRGKHGKA